MSETSPRVLVVVHEDHAGLGRLEPVLVERLGEILDERRPDKGDPLPADLSGHAGVVVLGGSMAAWEDEVAPWLPATRDLLAHAVDTGVPVLGICLGHQLLALATGGRVDRGGAGLEVGLVDVGATHAAATDALLGPVVRDLGASLTVPHWHTDAVLDLPPGAVRLVEGSRYANQAFRVGDAAWGLQYHPEVTGADFGDWLEHGHGSLLDAGHDPATIRAALADHDADLQRLAVAHAAAFADVVASRPAR